MYDEAKLKKDLLNAHKAGDTEAAKKLANALVAQRKQSKTAPENSAKQFNEKYGLHPFVGVPEQYNALGHGIDQGAGFGFGDEITAGGAATAAKLKSLVSGNQVDLGEAYKEALAARRGQMKDYEKTNPMTALVTPFLGGMVSGGGLANAGATAMKGAKTFGGLVKGAAIDGAAYGGVAGAGNAEGGLADRAASAGLGAGVGGVVGAGSQGLLSSGLALKRAISDKFSANFGKPEQQTAARLNEALKQSRLTPEQVKAKVAELGEEAVIADVLGEPGKALARSAANNNPEARDILENMSNTRIAGQGDRLNSVLSKAAGLDGIYSPRELGDLAKAKDRPAIDEAYDLAREAGHDIDLKQFRDLFKSAIVVDGWKKGKKLARERMISKGNYSGEKPSIFALLDETKKTLDSSAKPKKGESPTNEQSITADFAKQLRVRTDEALPSLEYADARGLARNLYDKENAIDLGEALAKPYPNDVVSGIQQIKPDNRNFVGQGYAAKKIEQINNRRTTPGVVDALFGSKNQQNALGIALGRDGADSVQKQLAAERAFARTHRALTGNSTTARQLTEMAAFGAAGAGAGYGFDGGFGGVTLGALAALGARKGGREAFKRLIMKKEEEIAPMVAKALIGRELPEGPAAQAVVKEVSKDPVLQHLFIRALSQQAGGAAP